LKNPKGGIPPTPFKKAGFVIKKPSIPQWEYVKWEANLYPQEEEGLNPRKRDFKDHGI